jgi:hypothetical protein
MTRIDSTAIANADDRLAATGEGGDTSGAFSSDPRRQRLARFICLAAAVFGWANLAILGFVGLSKNPPTAGFDLQLLVDAGKRVAAGESPYDFNAVAHGLEARDLFYSYPPIVAQLLAPLPSLPSWVILAGWCLGSAVGLAFVAGFVARSPVGRSGSGRPADSYDAVLVAIAAAPFFFPFLVALLFGNMDAWFPFLFGAVVLILASGRAAPSRAASVAGGVALAIASIVKLHPGSLVVWLAVRWHRGSEPRSGLATTIAATVAAGAALLAASLVVGGIGPWRDYVDYLRVTSNADLATWLNIGPASILALLAGDSNLAHVIAVFSAVAAVVATVAAARLVRDPLLSLTCAIVASLIVLPVTWYHYPVVLIPIALAAWLRSRGTPDGRRVTRALLGTYVVADAAILIPVALWLGVALLFTAVSWSRPSVPDPPSEARPRKSLSAADGTAAMLATR